MVALTSCSSESAEPNHMFCGKDYDIRLLGEWERNSMIRDSFNGITLVTDIIHFRVGNTGDWKIMYFDELHEQEDFTFYTNEDSLFLCREGIVQRWNYSLREDTLIMTSPIADSLNYLDAKSVTSRFIKVH